MELMTTVVYEWKLFSLLLLQRHDGAWERNLSLSLIRYFYGVKNIVTQYSMTVKIQNVITK